MKLLLTSAGLTNSTIIHALKGLAGKSFSELSVAFIPTAANVEDGDKWWLVNDLKNVQMLGWKLFDIVDISALPEETVQSRLERVDVVVVGGGNTYHIMSWIEKTNLTDLLRTKIYVGISAGSMITPENVQFKWDKEIYDEDIHVDEGKGLGFVNFHIFPHLNNKDFPKANLSAIERLVNNTNDEVYAIDDQTAIIAVDKDSIVVSEGEWKKFN